MNVDKYGSHTSDHCPSMWLTEWRLVRLFYKDATAGKLVNKSKIAGAAFRSIHLEKSAAIMDAPDW